MAAGAQSGNGTVPCRFPLRKTQAREPKHAGYRHVPLAGYDHVYIAGGRWSVLVSRRAIQHFITTPPAFDGSLSGAQSVDPALSQSFLHWGFLAWAVLGTLSTIVLMYAHHQGGVKLRPRALLYPLVGDRLENHWFGSVIDACSIIAVAAGTIADWFPCLTTQLQLAVTGYVDDSMTVQLTILATVVLIYSLSAFTGMDKGLQWLSQMNVIGALALVVAIVVLGPTTFIFSHFGEAFGTYLANFGEMSLSASDSSWNSWWTWFFWGWFIGFAPMMGIFIARISQGRSIRELIFAVAVGAPIATNFWFTVLGGTGIFLELQTPGVISAPLENAGLPAVLLACLEQLPLSSVLIPAFLVLTTTFVATTGDSMAYSIAMAVSGENEPGRKQRLFWALVMGIVAGVLLLAGDGGLDALQSFIVITAVPVSMLIAATLITGPLAVLEMDRARQQTTKLCEVNA